MGKTHQRKTQKEAKTKVIHGANINHSARPVRSRDQGDCTTKYHRYSITEVYGKNPGGQNRATSEAETNRKSLTNNVKTKKPSPNERKGGSLRNNGK